SEPRVTIEGFAGSTDEMLEDLVTLGSIDVDALRERRHARRRVRNVDGWELARRAEGHTIEKFRSSEVQKFRSSEVQKFRSAEVRQGGGSALEDLRRLRIDSG